MRQDAASQAQISGDPSAIKYTVGKACGKTNKNTIKQKREPISTVNIQM